MKLALHAEWTKLRTLAGSRWLLLGTIASTVALSAAASAAIHYSKPGAVGSPGALPDLTRISLTGIQGGQLVVAILAVLLIAGEYGTGMIRTTLIAMPHRPTVLAAKAAILSGAILVSGAIAVLASVWAGRLLLPSSGFNAANGYGPLSLTDGPTLRAAVGSVLYLTLIGLLSLGIATLVRDSVTSVGVVLGLLYLFPIVISAVTDPNWKRHLEQIAPMSAGLNIQRTVDLQSLALSPWAGLGVLAAWAAGALLAAAAVLQLRDA